MKFEPSRQWRFLEPMYRGAVCVRNAAYDFGFFKSFESLLPVVSIGNIRVGGTGKSPFCACVVKLLQELNTRPVILTRGYGGSERGPLRVGSEHTSKSVGDEPVMLFQLFGESVPVVISRDRVIGAAYIEELHLGDVIVLDDGFQHRRLNRDVDIVLLNAVEDLNQQLLLPAGVLREPVSSIHKRASAVVVMHRNATEIDMLENKKKFGAVFQQPVFCAQIAPTGFRNLLSGAFLPLDAFKGQEVQLVSGIANPEQFFKTVESLGAIPKIKSAFPDHYQFNDSDWKSFASNSQLPLITTAKDSTRLRQFFQPEISIFTLEIEAKFSSESEQKEFLAFIAPHFKLPNHPTADPSSAAQS